MNQQLERILDNAYMYIAVMVFLSIESFGLGIVIGLLWMV